jgi:hypothetical protein
MKFTTTVLTLALSLSTLITTSCSSSGSTAPASGVGSAPAADGSVLAKPLAAAHQSALQALAAVGANVTVNEAAYLEGKRPHKMGVMVGSGGETIKITLTAQGQQTHVSVATKKSILGIAGQKNWDAQVLAAMR